MFATTKQMREILRSAAANTGARVWSCWTDKTGKSRSGTGNMRYVGMSISGSTEAVAAEANKIAAESGFTNKVRAGGEGFYVRCNAIIA
jgi:hypothetical protein